MGVKTTDVFPLNPAYPDALNPVRMDIQGVAFGVTRAMTTATKVAVLAADTTMLDVRFYPTTAPNNVTTATVTLTATYTMTGTTVTLGTQDVTLTTSGFVEGANYFNLEQIPAATRTGDIIIEATYAETGTASTTGGPFYFMIEFVR